MASVCPFRYVLYGAAAGGRESEGDEMKRRRTMASLIAVLSVVVLLLGASPARAGTLSTEEGAVGGCTTTFLSRVLAKPLPPRPPTNPSIGQLIAYAVSTYEYYEPETDGLRQCFIPSGYDEGCLEEFLKAAINEPVSEIDQVTLDFIFCTV